MDNPYAPSHAPMNEPPLREQRGGRRLPFSGWWPVGFGGLAGLLLRLIFWGLPGEAYSAMLGSFIMGSPILVGAVTVYLAELVERRTWAYYFTAPMVATALYVVGSLALMIEGWICAIVIIPMFALLGGLSGLAMGAICRMTHWPAFSVLTPSIMSLTVGPGKPPSEVVDTRVRSRGPTRSARSDTGPDTDGNVA